ncbi:molybdenum cofactor guanylyltransferase [Kineosporia succinea]|uniref:Molybdopterin-guanine dinucleotide biosynthesis protein A n=1 Tax=Kineosporia succinea TaxID=84632 RepID=A0ABT9P2C6_9ACTN|nr:NTP transferase domain-containing protein [Kineosporia succinea]MDP9826652.1 molybdopterin-guanine dinucleotide biosynthesis protein A [Kineosporia succinea]
MTAFATVVLAGGTGERLGGVDKAAIEVAGVSLLDGVLLATTAAETTVIVGQARPTVRDVAWAREDPPGTGPLAGLFAGVEALGPDAPGLTAVFATDLTRLGAADVRRLVNALATTPEAEADAALFVDAEGRRQPLAAVYRTAVLTRVLRSLLPLDGKPVRALVKLLGVVEVPDHGASQDCDTPEQLARLKSDEPDQPDEPDD